MSMPAPTESQARTRAFARVIGPYLVIVTGILVVRAPNLGPILSALFQNEALVWMMGALLFFCGLLIIAFHQYWSSPAAVMISLFGWFLAIRGIILLAFPQLIQRGGVASLHLVPAVRIGFSLLVLIGLWLTYIGWFTKPPAAKS
ncbi:MAG: hypothetical protein HY892_02070 [Deltaproteobacteria bacterium]|nr:hypothetical protein [Deltaproteobacteria bacterium]